MPNTFNADQDPQVLTKLILDPSHTDVDEEMMLKLEEVTRRLCYALHNARSIQLGTGSMRSKAIRWVQGGPGGNYKQKQVPNSKPTSQIVRKPPERDSPANERRYV